MVSVAMTKISAPARTPTEEGYGIALPGVERAQSSFIPQGTILSNPETYKAIESGSGLTHVAATAIAAEMMRAAGLDPAHERDLLFAYVQGAQGLLHPNDPLYAIGQALLAQRDNVSMPSVPVNVLQKVIDDKAPVDARFVMTPPNLDGFVEPSSERPSDDMNNIDPLWMYHNPIAA